MHPELLSRSRIGKGRDYFGRGKTSPPPPPPPPPSSVDGGGPLRHPKFKAAAVVAKPNERWARCHCAFVETALRAPTRLLKDIMDLLPRSSGGAFKTPKPCVCRCPKPATGQDQENFELRNRPGQEGFNRPMAVIFARAGCAAHPSRKVCRSSRGGRLHVYNHMLCHVF